MELYLDPLSMYAFSREISCATKSILRAGCLDRDKDEKLPKGGRKQSCQPINQLFVNKTSDGNKVE